MGRLRFGGVLAPLVAALVCVPGALSAPPSNDSFGLAELIEGSTQSIVRSNVDATNEPGEPDHAGNAGGASVWFRWIAPADGLVTFYTGGSLDTLLAVYTGSSLSTLTHVASDDDWTEERWSKVGFAAEMGETYFIAVDGFDGSTESFYLSWQPAQRPQNDSFGAATTLSSEFPEWTTGSNFLASGELGEPAHAGGPGDASVWYRWTAPRNGTAIADLCSATFDSLLAVYTGPGVAALTPVAADDNACGLASFVEFEAVAGVTYWIAVDGFEGDMGIYTLVHALRPEHDDFADAAEISGWEGGLQTTNVAASAEPGEPIHAGEGWGRSIWYRWTAPAEGTVAFDTCASSIDTVLAVYRGTSVANLEEVEADDYGFCESTAVWAAVEFDVEAGATYSIAIDTGNGGAGYLFLNWSEVLVPPTPIRDPSISGDARDGEVLTGDPGRWHGRQPISLAYRWERCLGRTCTPLQGETGTSYRVQRADLHTHVRFVVVAANAYGSTTATADSALIQPKRVRNLSPPIISGPARVNSMLFVVSPGEWDSSGSTPLFEYSWQRCRPGLVGCIEVSRGTLYWVGAASKGHVIRLVVTAYGGGAGNSATAVSAPTAVIGPALRNPAKAARCVVPRLVGKTLRAARAALTRSRCTLGKVRRGRSSRKRGLIVGQTPRPGTRLRVGGKVNVRVSLGRRR